MRFRTYLTTFFIVMVFAHTKLALGSQVMLARLEIPNRGQARKLLSIISTLDVADIKRGEWIRIITDAEHIDQLRHMGFRVTVEQEDLLFYYRSHMDSTKLMGGFQTYSETVAFLDSLAEHWDIAKKDSIGTSFLGRTIWALKISDNPEIDEDEPEILYTGLHHANEPISIEVLKYFISYLVDNYDSLPRITDLVNERELWFIPIVNPDGYVYNEEKHPYGQGMWRKNRDTTYSAKPACWGVDLNRNYSHRWGYDDNGSTSNVCGPTYRGPSPFSEPETQAMRDFVTAHEFALAMNYHSPGNFFIYPWGYDNIHTPDHRLFRAVADTVVAHTGYVAGTPWEVLYYTNGDACDWMYGDTESKSKIYAFTIEVGDAYWPDPDTIELLCQENLPPNLFIARIADSTLLWNLLPPDPPTKPSCPDVVYCDSLKLNWQHQDSLNPAVIFQLLQKQDYAKITDDLEGGLKNWCTATENWQKESFTLSTQRSYSGNYSLYSGQDYLLNVSATSVEWLTVDACDSLIFWCWYEIESDYDYVYVEVSTDGFDFTPIAGNITTNYDPNDRNRGNGITGSSNGWTLAKFSLDHYLGEQILVRVHYMTDLLEDYEGFYFDDFYPVETFVRIDTLAEATEDTFFWVKNLGLTGFIDEISPNPVEVGEEVCFVGHGGIDTSYYYQVRAHDAQSQRSMWSKRKKVYVYGDGFIDGCDWWSSVDGPLSTDSSFCTCALSIGRHAIDFKVENDAGNWSNVVSETLYVHTGEFIRGDYDGDGQVLTNDPLMELQWIFGVPSAPPPSCMDAADYDDDGWALTNDPLMTLQFIFGVSGSVDPAPPYPNCGADPTDGDALHCYWHNYCYDSSEATAYKPSVSVRGAENRLAAGGITPVGDVVSVPVDLTVTEAVCGFDISLGYDGSCLQFMEVVGGDGYDFYAVDTRQEGVVRIGGVPDIEMGDFMEAGTHRLAEIVFAVERKADVELDWRKVEVYGSDVSVLSTEWVGLMVKFRVELPKEFALRQNYPNPFNPITIIKYTLPKDCEVKLSVYNILGQKVATLVDEEQKAGYKIARWNASSFSSGIYFYRLKTGDFVQTRKMVVLK